MRLGIFGGSFDPPHIGHLLLAQDAITHLSLDCLAVVPAATQPLKHVHQTSAVHRLAMVRHCFDGVADVVVDPVEIDRGGLSFMVDTVDHFRRLHPSAVIHLLIGQDVVETLPRWREPDRLLSSVQLVVLDRASSPDSARRGADSAQETNDVEPPLAGLASARHLASRRVDVSSTEIRARVRDGRSIRGFVPDAVAAYIASAALYPGEPLAGVGPERA